MNEYETIVVARPELPADESKRLHDRLLATIEKHKGSLLITEDWGKRRLAYLIQRQQYGNYIYYNYAGPAELPLEIDRNHANEDNLLRFLTVRLGTEVDVEERRLAAEERHRIRKEKLAAQAAAAAEANYEDMMMGEDEEGDMIIDRDMG